MKVRLTAEDLHLIHHALRMLAKYPGIGEDGHRASALADVIWDAHVADTNRRIQEEA